jgi:DNA-binding transcriptional ArsR family regulator
MNPDAVADAVALGDADVAAVAAVLADRGRWRVLAALGDGRALPASMLAAEAGVAASTASEHLTRLVDAGLLTVERHGRYRYFRLAGPQVADALEALAQVAPPAPVRSLREGTRAEALRFARTCYDHLAGRVGVAVMDVMLRRGFLEDGEHAAKVKADPEALPVRLASAAGLAPARPRGDRLAAPGRAIRYGLTETGAAFLGELGVDLAALPPRRPAVRYCIDWSEQRSHLAGGVGAALTSRLLELDWLRPAERSRAVHLTDQGRAGLATVFGIDAERAAS